MKVVQNDNARTQPQTVGQPYVILTLLHRRAAASNSIAAMGSVKEYCPILLSIFHAVVRGQEVIL